MLANYYLGALPSDSATIALLAKNDALIITPEQANVGKSVISQIKKLNPDIILLAYIPSGSDNSSWRVYPGNLLE